jgi:hypothetical protein
VNDAWFQRAAERAPAILLPFDRISEAHALVCGAIGAPWLEEQDRLTGNATTNIGAAHSLYRDLNATTDTSIAAVCELAHYLRAFQADPALPSVLTDLRSPKFDPVFLELAFAYRWQDAGADVHLRPATPKGEADFDAVIDGLPFTVEVSSFPHDYFGGVQFRITSVIADTVKSAIDEATPVAVRVTILDPSGNLEATVRQAVKDAARTFNASDANEGRIEIASCSVLISTLSDTDPRPHLDEFGRPVFDDVSEWDVILRAVQQELPVGTPLYQAAKGREVREDARIYVRFPGDPRDRYARIGKKLKKEVQQLKGIRTPRVVILDVSDPTFGDVFDLEQAALRGPIERVLESTPELACVFVMMRRWTTAFRYKYYGLFIDNPHSVYRLPQKFMDRMTMREWQWDFLGARAYPETHSYEDALKYHALRRE